MVGPSEPTNFVLTYEEYMEEILYKVILSEVINAAQISFHRYLYPHFPLKTGLIEQNGP